ncbi:hypothetical protein FH972_023732 [Carpinus fangiana]|uniref:Signal recognition particle receptor subunit beta n=1 Tax=Carpinus fangiana TaxID=176857 RepID=A0A5N6KWA8_9ROSI|nr:hypothetical protein FH972_023732 [Carpinus fangiana]
MATSANATTFQQPTWPHLQAPLSPTKHPPALCSSKMDLSSLAQFLTRGLTPSLATIIITFLVVILSPLALHLYIYRSKSTTSLPTFLLVGPSGSGKTSLLTLFETGKPSATHLSQSPLTVECDLPVATEAASNRFRSRNDSSNREHRKFLLSDTPGHGKLRYHAVNQIVKPENLRGIIYLVDASTLSTSSGDEHTGLTEAAQYLYDLLLILQKKHTTSKTSKGPSETPVLIAANKLDLFTALPKSHVRTALETELTKLRSTKSKGLIDSGVGMDDQTNEEESLGGDGEGRFTFALMEEYNIPVSVAGGNVLGGQGEDTKEFWDWIGEHL